MGGAADRVSEGIAYWLQGAQYDLDTAEALLRTERLLYVGFMCHQAMEKTLKAHYVKARQDVPPFSHNLRYLASQAGMYDTLSEEQKTLLDTLQPLNIESRYPDHKRKVLESLNSRVVGALLEQTRGLHRWLRNLL